MYIALGVKPNFVQKKMFFHVKWTFSLLKGLKFK